MSKEERNVLYKCLNALLIIFKYVLLIVFIVFLGFTLALIVGVIINVLRGTSTNKDVIISLISIISPYTKIELNNLAASYGLSNVIVGSIAFAIAKTITYFSLYKIMDYTITIVKNILVGEIFNRESLEVLDNIIPYSFISGFAYPAILFVTISITHTYSEYADFSYVGVLFLVGALLLKVIINNGLKANKSSASYDEIIDDYKADIDNLKIANVRKDAEIAKLKKQLESVSIETTEKDDKIEKKEETGEKTTRKHHHSRAKKNKETSK